MLYMLVVRVFGNATDKWYYLLLLGWGEIDNSDPALCQMLVNVLKYTSVTLFYSMQVYLYQLLLYLWAFDMNIMAQKTSKHALVVRLFR